MKKKINTFWVLIGIGVLVFILLILVSNVLDVGEKLRKINVYDEYWFYALLTADAHHLQKDHLIAEHAEIRLD